MQKIIGVWLLGAVLCGLVCVDSASAWDARRFSHGWYGPRTWVAPPPPVVAPLPYAPTPLPYGSRFYYPPGVPFSYYDAGSMSTYCLSPTTGVYYVCGYSVPPPDFAEATFWPSPGSPPPFGEQSPPSGVLMFQLPQEAQATVDGAPVGLSGGVGAVSVVPGRHQIVVRASGRSTEHTVMVTPHAILTVTPSAVVPTAP